MKSKITFDSIVLRNDEKLLSSNLADETVMMNVETGDYLGINEVGSHIWRLLETPISAKNIYDSLMETFAVDPATCQHQTLSFLQKLEEENLLQIQ